MDDGQKAHEKMFDINEVPPHTSQNGHHQTLQTIKAGDSVEKRELTCTVSGNINWYSHCGKQYGSFLKNPK